MIIPEIKVFPAPKDVAVEAANRIVAAAKAAVAKHGSFSIALSGGSTPKALYELLSAEPYKSQMPWGDVEIYFGDERCVPQDHKDSNFKMAKESLLSKVPIPATSVFRMEGELEAPAGAEKYRRILDDRFADYGIDVVLLGMGDDGHTASIFPGTEATREKGKSVIGYFAENSSTGKSWRITLTAPFINRAEQVMFLICGASKEKRLAEVLEGPRDPERLPSQLIAPSPGQLIFLIDSAAAGMQGE